MALVKKQSNQARTFIILGVGVVLAVAGYFLFQRFANPTSDDGSGLNLTNRQIITEFGESILEDKRYKALQSYEQEVTIDPLVEGGNPNPFE